MPPTHSSPSISAIILSMNNADTISACINSVAWANEVLLYDSGSTDGTQAIAESLGAKVIVDLVWSGFGLQRQKAQACATGDWLLWVDSDEQVTPELKQSIQHALASAEAKTAFSCNRLSEFFGRFIRHSGWRPDRIVRLYARDHYSYNEAPVHEKVNCPTEQVQTLEGDLLHYTSPTFSVYMSKSLRYANDWATERYAAGRRVSVAGIIVRTKIAFLKKYFLKCGFLDGRHGLLLAVQSSHYTFNKYFALWTLAQQNKTTSL